MHSSYIDALVASAPPPTPAVLDRLSTLLAPDMEVATLPLPKRSAATANLVTSTIDPPKQNMPSAIGATGATGGGEAA